MTELEPMATALRRWTISMYEPQAERASAAKRARAEERAAAAVVSLSLDALMDRMGWSREYAEHLVQLYCDCDIDREGGWEYCEHARDLGSAL